MSIYKLKLFEYQKIRNTYELEFDTKDQAAWDGLLNAARMPDEFMPDEDLLLNDMPKSAPADPAKWFELCKLIYEVREPFKCIKKAELLNLQGDEFDVSIDYQLEDGNGNILLQERHDDLF